MSAELKSAPKVLTPEEIEAASDVDLQKFIDSGEGTPHIFRLYVERSIPHMEAIATPDWEGTMEFLAMLKGVKEDPSQEYAICQYFIDKYNIGVEQALESDNDLAFKHYGGLVTNWERMASLLGPEPASGSDKGDI